MSSVKVPNIFSIVGQSWTFYRRQPVLNSIALWLFFIPLALNNVISRFLEPPTVTLSPLSLIGLIVILADNIIILWGIASVILVGKRLLLSQAGRKRTSFHAVRKHATHLIIPILLTSLLRMCFTFFWLLLFIVPGIIYALRTTFYAIVIVCEGRTYRAALEHSKNIVKGKTWKMLGYLIFLTILLYTPLGLIIALEEIVGSTDARFVFSMDIINGGFTAIATIFYTLSLIILYGELKRGPKEFIPPPPDGSS